MAKVRLPDLSSTDKARVAEAVAKPLAQQLKDVLGEYPPRNTPEWRAYWAAQDEALRLALRPELERLALGSLDALMALVKTKVVAELVDPIVLLGREAVLLWLDSYTFGMVKGINETSRDAIEDALQKALTLPGFTRDDLVAELSPVFGPVRADMIAITETTRAYSEGQRLGAQELEDAGIVMVPFWDVQGNNPCELCIARDGKEITDGVYPPLHVNCECGHSYEVKPP